MLGFLGWEDSEFMVALFSSLIFGVGIICLIIYLSSDRTEIVSKDGEYINVTAQIQEVADDGVLSQARHYQVRSITTTHDNLLILHDARDDFGKRYETIRLQNIPTIIEEPGKTYDIKQ